MAATDTFEWFVSTHIKNPEPQIRQLIGERRIAMQALRSEDERQRYVECVMAELREVAATRMKR